MDAEERRVVQGAMILVGEAFEALQEGQRQAAVDALVDAMGQLETIAG